MSALHKDVRTPLERSQAAVGQTPCARVALGPTKADGDVEGSRKHLEVVVPAHQ